jgi:hypothetical protein
MTKLILALLAGGALMLAAGIPAARAETSCTTTLTGTISGNVVVPPGRICVLNAATVTGNVTVEAGATLGVDNGSTVEGNISGDQCQGVEIGVTGTATNSVHGNVSIQNCTQGGYGTPGQPLPLTRINGNFLCQGVAAGCGANYGSVSGNVQVDDNPGGALVDGNSVGGNVQVNKNGSATFVENNTVNGNLKCQGNESLTASGNTVHGNTHCSP